MTLWIKADIKRSNREAESHQGDSETESQGNRETESQGDRETESQGDRETESHDNESELSESIKLSNWVKRLEKIIAVEAAERRKQLNVLNDQMLAILKAVKGAEK